MRVFTLISKDGDAWSLAQRIQDEGHRAVVYINNKEKREIGNGIVEKSTEQRVLVDENGQVDEDALEAILHPIPDCVIVDSVYPGMGIVADIIKERYPVVGCSRWGDKVEQVDYGRVVAKAMDIKFLDVPNAMGVSLGILFNGKDVNGVFFYCLDENLLEGDRGPNTTGMGITIWLGSKVTKLHGEVIDKVLPVLRRMNHHGLFTVNLSVTESGVSATGFSARLDHRVVSILSEMFKGRIGDLLYGLAVGTTREISTRSHWGMGVSLCLLPCSLISFSLNGKETHFTGINRDNQRHIWLQDAWVKEGGHFCRNYVGMITARGDEVESYSPVRDARRRILRTISNLVIPSVVYRRDVGNTFEQKYGQLKAWGWI